MRKIKYHIATTLDGFIAREDGSFDFFVMEGDHATDYLTSLATYDTVIMGRRTYDVGLKVGVTDPYPNMATYVFSRSLEESPNPRVKVVANDVETTVQRLKEQPGTDIYFCGGGDLATTLFAAGLIDEVLIKLNPVLLGSGIPLAPRLRDATHLDLLSTKVYRNGVVLLHYAIRR